MQRSISSAGLSGHVNSISRGVQHRHSQKSTRLTAPSRRCAILIQSGPPPEEAAVQGDQKGAGAPVKPKRSGFTRRKRVMVEPRVSVTKDVHSKFTEDFWSSLDACEGFFTPNAPAPVVTRLRIGKDEEEEEETKGASQPEFAPWAVDAGTLLPGICVAAVVMQAGFAIAGKLGAWLLAAQGLSASASSPISGIPIAIVLGVTLNSALQLPPTLVPGLQYCVKKVLRVGIVCVGIKLSAVEVLAVGGAGIPVVLTCIAVGLTSIVLLARRLGLSPRLGALLAAGTSICGVTAITALAPAIKATRKEMGIAVANVVMCGTLGMLLYPVLAHVLLHNSTQVGLFLGTGIHDTSQVIGAALTYREMYGDELVLKVATVTKLARNLFLAAVMPALTFWNVHQHKTRVREAQDATAAAMDASGLGGDPSVTSMLGSEAGAEAGGFHTSWQTLFPLFILGFLAMSGLRSLGDATLAGSGGLAYGLLDKAQWKGCIAFIGDVLGSRYLLGIAMAAVGLGTNVKVFKGVGVRPFAVGVMGALIVAATGFVCALVVA